MRPHDLLLVVVQESTVVVLPSGADASLEGFGHLRWASQIQVPAKLPVEDLRRSLDNQLAVQVLAFPDAHQLFGGFGDKEWALCVARRIARLSGVWCCSKQSLPRRVYGMDSDIAGLLSISNAVS